VSDNDREQTPDVFCDGYLVRLDHSEAIINFLLSPPDPPVPGRPTPSRRVATVRMSPAMFKLFIFKAWQSIRRQETLQEALHDVPSNVLLSEQIKPSDWEAFWK
jgi:hypothetical protein